MSDGRSENSEDVETLSVSMPLEAQQLQFLDASVWADGIEGIMQPDRKKGKSGGRLTSRFVWTDAVSAVV
jgi:hypothetical protein